MSLLTFLRESVWGYPIISAIHVLGIAWFGATVLVSQFREDLRVLRRIGLALVLVSGVVLFMLHPVQYYGSISFQAKIVLLVLLMLAKPGSRVSLILWVAVIFASRGIAFG